MKGLVITLALAGLASTATLNAQVYGSRPLPSTNTSINVDGSWRAVGRDGSGNTIYERRTQDRNGNILVQRAVRDSRGNMSIISSSTVNNSSYGVGTSVDGSWRVVGRDGSGNTIYERRTQDRNGNILVQRAVRDLAATCRSSAATPSAIMAITAITTTAGITAIAATRRVPIPSATSSSVAAGTT
jgi:NADH:ubiquinone oxidoreductase subunit